MRPLVFISGPYSHPDPVENTHKAIKVAEEVEALGADVFIPHLSLLWHIVSPAPISRWYERDNAVLARCDALVRIPGASSGADAETQAMAHLGRPVYAWPGEFDDLMGWIEEWER